MYERILILVDKRPITQAAVQEGIALAASQAASLVFLSVLPHYTVPTSDAGAMVVVSAQEFLQAARVEAEATLGAARTAAELAGVPAQTVMTSGETEVAAIIEGARRHGCDLIVVASEARNALMRLLTGSVIPGLITLSPLPVLICKPRPKSKLGDHAQAKSMDSQARAGRDTVQ